METLTQKLNGLHIAIRIRIAAKILEKGVLSEYSGERVLKPKSTFTLEFGRWLTEITPTELIDNEGYANNHSVMRIEELCEAIDKA